MDWKQSDQYDTCHREKICKQLVVLDEQLDLYFEAVLP
jgi:hypothetical protein